MKLRFFLPSALFLAILPAVAGAQDLSYFSATVTSSSPTQLGRLSRNNIQQTWGGAEPFPGIINPAVSYSYTTYTFLASTFVGANYIEITDYDTLSAANLFLSAYAGSYNPSSLATNWLGDEGASGNLKFYAADPGDARYFDVIVPNGQNLVLVLNTSAVAGLNDPHLIDVSAYGDNAYGAPVPTPEPSTFLTLGTGLLGIAGVARRRFNSKR